MFGAGGFIIWVRGRRLDPVGLIRPGSPVQMFAAFTAKRAEAVAGGIGAKRLAAWAGNFWHGKRMSAAERKFKVLIAATR